MGCTSVATIEGARPVPAGVVEMTTFSSFQSGTNPLSAGLGFPVPQQDISIRYGMAPDVDLGLRLYLFGLRADVRYRFATWGPWDVAIAPGVGGLVMPLPGYQSGVVDLLSPLRIQRDLGEYWNVTLTAEARVRETFAAIQGAELGEGASGLLQTLAGGGVRLERPLGRVTLGLGWDVLTQPGRGLPPAASGGVGFSWNYRRTK